MVRYASEYLFEQANSNKNKDVFGSVIFNVKAYGAKGNGITDDSNSIYRTISAAAASGGIVFFPPGTYITSNQTVPNNVTLWLANGAKVSVASGSTFTINGGIDAGMYQIFDGLGTVNGSPDIPTCYPDWFGAVHNGVSDDSPAIQKAVNFYSHITFVPAVYKLFSSINVPSFRELNGQSSAFSSVAGLTEMFIANDNVKFIRMVCNGDTPSAIAFKLNGTFNWMLECSTFNVLIGINSRGARQYVTDCDIRASQALLVENNAEVREFSGNIFEGGVRITGGAGLRFINNDILGGTYNMLIDPNLNVVASVVVTGCFFDQGTSGCLNMIPSGSGAVVRCKFANCWFTGSGGRGINTNTSVSGLQIIGCDIYNNAQDGIAIGSSGGTTITGCNIAGNVGSGVAVGGGITNFNITGNTIAPAGGFGANAYGIFIVNGASDIYVITSNILRGNTVLSISDGGTGTNKQVANNVT